MLAASHVTAKDFPGTPVVMLREHTSWFFFPPMTRKPSSAFFPPLFLSFHAADTLSDITIIHSEEKQQGGWWNEKSLVLGPAVMPCVTHEGLCWRPTDQSGIVSSFASNSGLFHMTGTDWTYS